MIITTYQEVLSLARQYIDTLTPGFRKVLPVSTDVTTKFYVVKDRLECCYLQSSYFEDKPHDIRLKLYDDIVLPARCISV